MIWHKLSEKLAPINEKVFILSINHRRIKEAKLRVCENTDFLKGYAHNENNPIISGDLYWLITCFRDDEDDPISSALTLPMHYPYWIEMEKLIKETTKTIKEEEPEDPVENRAEILDL